MDDANNFIADNPETVFEKRCYDKGVNICQASPHKPTMTITFDDCLTVEIQGVVTALIDDGYRFKNLISGHYGKKIAIFDL